MGGYGCVRILEGGKDGGGGGGDNFKNILYKCSGVDLWSGKCVSHIPRIRTHGHPTLRLYSAETRTRRPAHQSRRDLDGNEGRME
jgi:hypothetical protein